mmetsp:Transcript_87882/g.210019  ORF Transcript_87882/g.210019 Transcript_87882/m.210019 type:complete len:99 (+) Transcript_87882:580-876(+)
MPPTTFGAGVGSTSLGRARAASVRTSGLKKLLRVIVVKLHSRGCSGIFSGAIGALTAKVERIGAATRDMTARMAMVCGSSFDGGSPLREDAFLRPLAY